jgi:O-antigen/teichoic acid export membrane protein
VVTASTAAAESLRVKVRRGLGWKVLSQVVAQGSRTIVGILLAHILTPRDFGLAAMALVFTGIASIFTDLSLGAALVQRPTITEDDRSTVFWTTLATGTFMTLVGIALAPLAASFFNTPAVEPLFAATATLAFLSAIAVTQMALLTRDMDFRSLELREMGSTLAGASTAIALAFAGFGAWAIVGQALCTAAVSAVLVWRAVAWRPRWRYSRESLRTLGSFGIKTFFARLLGYLNINADNLLIGRSLGTQALGVYAVAYNVMFLPISRIALPIQQVLFAAFVRMQKEHVRLGQAWLRGNQLISAVTVPTFLGMAVVAPDFVPVVLGDRWQEAIPVLQLLSLAGVAHGVQTLNWSVVQAFGKAGLLLRFMLFATVVTVGGFVIGLQWGVVGVAASFAVSRVVVLVVNTWITCRAARLPIWDFPRSLAGIFGASLAMAAVVYFVRLGLANLDVPQAARLLLLVALGIAVYAALILWRAPDLVTEARTLLRNRGRAS